VGAVHGVTVSVTTNDVPAGGVSVEFAITDGPNTGLMQVSTTTEAGTATFNYTGNGGAGTDIIRAIADLGAAACTSRSTQVWVTPGSGATIQCPGNIVTNAGAGAGCSRSVPFSVVVSGSPMPTTRCRIGATVITSPHAFPPGVTTVTCTASNANGSSTCSFTVTVTETVPPEITCPGDVFATTEVGAGSAVVTFDAPAASDNCGEPTVVCSPASGSTFATGTTPVTCTATDDAGNTTNCTFNVTVEEVAGEAHDLAVVRLRAPRFLTLTPQRSTVTRRIVVTIQNRSSHTETIFDAAQLTNLVTLTAQSFDSNVCADLTPVILERPPQRRFPINLRSRQLLNVYFEVTFDCAVNPGKGAGQEDFIYTARVNHQAIDGIADTHPECDVCPRPPLDGGFDPNPNGRIRDRGCGAPAGRGFFGGDVLTDVIMR
jgi:hypothetical protein